MPANATILLTPDEMAAADRATAASGISSFGLMEQAGQAVAAAALAHWPGATRIAVLCGPGNNGGDGYVAGRALHDAGQAVEIYSLGDPNLLDGDARQAFDLCPVAAQPLEAYRPQAEDLVVDGLFGAGLARKVPPSVERVVGMVAEAGVPVLAIDLPSGVCGRRGAVLDAAFQAARTVTFMARKPGHLLLPGRSLCGPVEIADIGMPGRILKAAAGVLAANTPDAWQHQMPVESSDTHKFRRGHLVVFSGSASHTGAARLSAAAGLAAGAGLVTVAAPADAMPVQAAALTAVMLRQVDDGEALRTWHSGGKLSAFVIGPGFGIGEKARRFVDIICGSPVVVDADAITSFAERPDALFHAFSDGPPRLVLTPHEGEFGRLFKDIAEDPTLSKVEKAQAAARRSYGVIVYKGADTVIAAPDGRAVINENGPPWLATAGSGDVLAGVIGALLAQGVPAFEAAAAGVWLHGAAGGRAGRGMTAEDLVRHLAPPPEA